MVSGKFEVMNVFLHATLVGSVRNQLYFPEFSHAMTILKSQNVRKFNREQLDDQIPNKQAWRRAHA